MLHTRTAADNYHINLLKTKVVDRLNNDWVALWCDWAGEDINVEERGRGGHFSGHVAVQYGTYSAIGSKEW